MKTKIIWISLITLMVIFAFPSHVSAASMDFLLTLDSPMLSPNTAQPLVPPSEVIITAKLKNTGTVSTEYQLCITGIRKSSGSYFTTSPAVTRSVTQILQPNDLTNGVGLITVWTAPSSLPDDTYTAEMAIKMRAGGSSDAFGSAISINNVSFVVRNNTPPQTFDFNISLNHSSITVQAGQTPDPDIATITLTKISGDTQLISIDVLNLPSSVGYFGYSPSNTLTPNSVSQCYLAMKVYSTAPSGTYNLIIRASGGGITHDVSFTLNVTGATPENRKPIFDSVSYYPLRQGNAVVAGTIETLTINAEDPDGDTLSYRIDSAGITKISDNVFSWNVPTTGSGYNLIIWISDGTDFITYIESGTIIQQSANLIPENIS
jgi:hypothetical protein